MREWNERVGCGVQADEGEERVIGKDEVSKKVRVGEV